MYEGRYWAGHLHITFLPSIEIPSLWRIYEKRLMTALTDKGLFHASCLSNRSIFANSNITENSYYTKFCPAQTALSTLNSSRRRLNFSFRELEYESCEIQNELLALRVAVISAKNHKRQRRKRQRRKRQSVTAKREKSQTLKFLTAILTIPNLT